MEVLSYLEYSNKGGIVDVSYLIEKMGWSGGITDFFAQQFNPELVYKYFNIDTYEGIEGKFYTDILIQDFLGNSIEFSADDNYYYLNGLATYKPRTLDDFINDCQRAGIELQWKEQS